jgi:hypothetical protein
VIIREAMLRAILLATAIAVDGRIKNLAALASCANRLGPGPARFPRHDAALGTNMFLHADIGILPLGYSDWAIA